MEEIKKEKKQRDWLTAWTILVLPGLFLSIEQLMISYGPRVVFAEVGDPVDISNELSVIYFFLALSSPFICVIWSALYLFFAKKSINRSLRWKYGQLTFNIVLSIAYLWIMGMIFYNYLYGRN